MSIPYVETGRTKQKVRTRTALIDAARSLVAGGRTPTVEDAATEAGISRTTAYRYFSNQRELLVAAHPQIEQPSLLPGDAPLDPTARLDIVVDRYLAMTVENEAALRTSFLLALDTEGDHRDQLLLRRGRVIGWIEDALEPLRPTLSAKAIRRLASAIRASAGIESLIWLCDVAGLCRDEAVELMKWSAQALLQAALTEATPKRKGRR